MASGCQNQQPDRSFVSGKPCLPPCWYGLQPGLSVLEDVRPVLRSLEFVDQRSVTQVARVWLNDPAAIEVRWDCVRPGISGCGRAVFSRDILQAIWYAPGYKLTFSDAVNELGPPECLADGIAQSEAGGCTIDLFWPAQGVSVGMANQHSRRECQAIQDTGKLDGTARVDLIIYGVVDALGNPACPCCGLRSWLGFSDP